MKYIIISDYSALAMIDDADFTKVSRHKWRLDERGYARTVINGKDVRMHVFLGCKNHDHADRNKLNNQRSNLRPATRSQNCANVRKNKITISKFKGVDFIKAKNRWRARIQCGNNRIYIGSYRSEIEAAIAYNVRAILVFGEFAVLNEV